MSVTGTTGVMAVGQILQCLTQESMVTVTELAQRCGIARSTAFDIVGRLEAAGLVERTAGGQVSVGPAAIAFGFARFGFARLHGPAEAVLMWLRDETCASAALVSGSGGEEKIILMAAADGRKSMSGETLSKAVRDASGKEMAHLRLTFPPGASRADRARAALHLQRAVDTLARYLNGREDS